MQRWWLRFRYTFQQILFPLICLQFIRTMIFPSGFDVILLFILFLAYLGFLLNMY